MKKLTFALFYLLSVSLAYTQNNNKLVGLALVKPDSVVLRWAPSSLPLWQAGIRYGYVVERFTISRNGQSVPDGLAKGTILSTNPIKPYPLAYFDNLAKTDDNAAVVQEAIASAMNLTAQDNADFQRFIKNYEELETKMGFALFVCDLSPSLAVAAGVRFTDRTAFKGDRYAYSIKPVQTPVGLTIEPLVIVVDAGKVEKLPAIANVKAIFLDKQVKLRWPVMLHKGIYTAYILEKSTDGVNYKQVSDLPLITVTENKDPDYFVYTDSLQQNGETTWYRVKGLTPFGETGPVSEPVNGSGSPEFSAYAVIDTAMVEKNKSITIRWRVTETPVGIVKGIIVSKTQNPDAMYKQLHVQTLGVNLRSFTDNAPFLSNYYRITLLGENNARSYSFPYLVQTEDNDPPAAPQMLAGKVDTSGIVTLTWKVNTEPDILGYKIFRANAPFEEFLNVSEREVMENLWKDTINLHTLSQKIYYKVVALDKHYNNSPYSAMLELTRPDTIKPVAAQIRKVEMSDKEIKLLMEASPSADVVKYNLYQVTDDTSRLLIVSWDRQLPQTFAAKLPQDVSNFKYLLETVDHKGNKASVTQMVYLPVTNLSSIKCEGVYHTSGKFIMLHWNDSKNTAPAKTIIYRAAGTGPLTIYETLVGQVNNYDDYKIEPETAYTYRIRVIYTDNSSSQLSKGVEVKPNK